MNAPEKKRNTYIARGEVESKYPGFLVSQDMFFVGERNGIGLIHQHTILDTYCNVAFAKLYTTIAPITSTSLLDDQVIPFFEKNELSVQSVITDRGDIYDQHSYKQYLATRNIKHIKIKPATQQTRDICECFHKTVFEEFYQEAFRTKTYRSIEQIQSDLDAWIKNYNYKRPNSGKMCCGRTPMETFRKGKTVWKKLN